MVLAGGSNVVTITANAITVRGVATANIWDVQVYQTGFNYTKLGNASPNSPTSYAVTVTGTVVGVPMYFEAIVQLSGEPYTVYLWGEATIPVGPFTRTINWITTGDAGFNVPNPNARFAFNFGSSANAGGTMTITNVTVTGP
jgi:hypothetical protein